MIIVTQRHTLFNLRKVTEYVYQNVYYMGFRYLNFQKVKMMIREEIPDYSKIILKVTLFTFRGHTGISFHDLFLFP